MRFILSLHVSSTMCSKHVEVYNKSYYKTRICALIWVITKNLCLWLRNQKRSFNKA